jgi:hypothetical protein
MNIASHRPLAIASVTALALAGAIACASPTAAAERARLSLADGMVPEGTTIDDTEVPAVARLAPELRDALEDAQAEAGIPFYVNSGWRTADFQQSLIDDALETYGSWEEASRWVASRHGSAHLTGDAVDIGGWDASGWLQANGAAHDLCQIYDNEGWHFELREGAAADGCPPRYADATEDPRNAAS